MTSRFIIIIVILFIIIIVVVIIIIIIIIIITIINIFIWYCCKSNYDHLERYYSQKFPFRISEIF